MNRRNFFSKTIAAIGAILVGPIIPAKARTIEIGPTILSKGAQDIRKQIAANYLREIQAKFRRNSGEIQADIDKAFIHYIYENQRH